MSKWRAVKGLATGALAALAFVIGASSPASAGEMPRAALSGQPTAAQKGWALGASAVLTESTGGRHDLLGGVERSPEAIRSTRKLLTEWWDVNSRDDLLRVLKWIDEAGHRVDFDRIGAALALMTADQRADLRARMKQDEELAEHVSFIETNVARLGRKGLVGWDYSRFISLCRWGYVVGYLDEEEAWARIMSAARVLQRTFDSWRDLGENYLVGREFWSPEHTERNGVLYRAAHQRLLADPESPWNRYPWGLDLGQGPGGGMR